MSRASNVHLVSSRLILSILQRLQPDVVAASHYLLLCRGHATPIVPHVVVLVVWLADASNQGTGWVSRE
jgi:hypothetical protein